MRKNAKSTARSNRPDLNVLAEQWAHVDTIIQTLRATLAPALQPLTENERRKLLEVGIANEAFTASYASMVTTAPGIVPEVLRPANTTRDWQTQAELFERRQALLQIVQQMADTMAALRSDCFASALIGYRFLTQGGVPPGLDPVVEPLREHWAKRLERKNQTRAANLALKAAQAQPQAPSSDPNTGSAPTPASEATVIPLNVTNGAATPRNGVANIPLAA